MKKLSIFSLSILLFTACTKPSNSTTTNNNTTVLPAAPAFTVDGIQDVSIDHTNTIGTVNIPLIIQYEDSTQQTVTVNVSGIPSQAGTNSTQNGEIARGIPTFDCSFKINYDYNTGASSGNIPIGTYPITVSCVGSLSGTKTFTFNLVVF